MAPLFIETVLVKDDRLAGAVEAPPACDPSFEGPPGGVGETVGMHLVQPLEKRFGLESRFCFQSPLDIDPDVSELLCSWGQDGLICGWDVPAARELWRICCADAFAVANDRHSGFRIARQIGEQPLQGFDTGRFYQVRIKAGFQ